MGRRGWLWWLMTATFATTQSLGHPDTLGEFANCPDECRCWNGAGGGKDGSGADCSKGGLDEKGLRSILAALPPSLHILIIGAPNWRPNNFSVTLDILRFKELRELHLVNSGLRTLGKRVFAGLTYLRVLNVADNKISYLSEETFEATSQLWHLSLADNLLGHGLLPTGAFMHLRNLRSLDLSRNQILQFPANLFSGLRNLSSLLLDGAELKSSELSNLLSDTPSLRRLSLRNASLTGLTKETFAGVPELMDLRLVEAGLKEVPTNAIQPLRNLRSLDLSHNRIGSVHPYALADLPHSLTSLSLAHNRLSGNPNGGMNRLEDYGIHPLAFSNSSLVSLDLSGNGYADFDSKVVAAAASTLRVLHLSHNPLRRIHTRHTQNLNLHSLHLAYIELSSLPSFLPYHFSQLEMLNLSGNPIQDFPAPTASYLMPSLKQLDISNCRLRSLPADLDGFFFGQLSRLFLSGNPWDCGCHLKSLISYLQSKVRAWVPGRIEEGSEEANEIRCATPTRWAGHSVASLGQPPDCALIFSSASGLTQKSEIGILVGAVVSVLLIVGIGGLFGCYARLHSAIPSRSRLFGRTYRTHEGSKGRFSSSSSEPSETNSLHITQPSSRLAHELLL